MPQINDIVRRRFEKFGPMYSEQLFGRTIVNVCDPDAIAKVLRVESSFPMRPGLEAVDMINKALGAQTGLISNEYDRWHRERVLLSPKLLLPKEVGRALIGFNEVAKDFSKRVAEKQQPDGTLNDLEGELFYWTVEAISRVLFDERLGFYNHPPEPDAVAFIDASYAFTANLGKLLFGLPFYKYINTPTYKKLKNAMTTVREIGNDMVKRKIALKERLEKATGEEHKLFLDSICGTGDKLPQETAVNVLIALIATGVGTSTTTLLWITYLMSRHPEVQEKLYKEISSVVGPKGEITSETIGQLPYLKACLKESFRFRPTAFVLLRKFDRDLELLGYNIPAGVDIMLYYHVSSTSELYYGETANEYIPERWLRDEAGNKEAYHPFASLPFGYGVRMCIGRRVAESEVYAFISQLLLNYRLEYAGEGELSRHMFGATIIPDDPVLVKFHKR